MRRCTQISYLRFHSSEPMHPLSHRRLILIQNKGSSDHWKWHRCRGSAAARRTPCYSPQTEQWHRQQGFCPLVDTVMQSCRTLEAGNQNIFTGKCKMKLPNKHSSAKKPPMVLVLLACTEILLYCPLLKISTDRCAVFLGQSGHRWQGVWCQGQSMKDTVVIAHCFVFFKHTVSTKLG